MYSAHQALSSLFNPIRLAGLLTFFLVQAVSAQTGLIQFEGVLNGAVSKGDESAPYHMFENHRYRATLEFDITGLEPSYSNVDSSFPTVFDSNKTTYSSLPMQLAIEVFDASNQVITTVIQPYDVGNTSRLYGENEASTHVGLMVGADLQSSQIEASIQFTRESFTADYFNEYLPFLELLDQDGSFPVDSGFLAWEADDSGEFLTGQISHVTTFYLHTCDEFSADGLDAPCDPLSLQAYISDQEQQNDDAQTEITSLNKQLQLADTRNSSLDRQVRQLQAEISSNEAQMAQLEQQNSAINTEIEQLQAQVADLQADNQRKQTSIVQLQQNNRLLSARLDQFRAQEQTLQRQIDALKAMNATLEAEATSLIASLATSEAQVTMLQDELASVDTSVMALQLHLQQQFGDDDFQIGADNDPVETLIQAIMELNPGQQQALFRNLDGEKSEGNSADAKNKGKGKGKGSK